MKSRINSYYVYILTNRSNKVLYTGYTNNLKRSINEHKNKVNEGFSSAYNVSKLVYFEIAGGLTDALKREREIK